MTKKEFDDLMAAIAQGVVNIDEGITTIEPRSRIHHAMVKLCTAVINGEVGLIEIEEHCSNCKHEDLEDNDHPCLECHCSAGIFTHFQKKGSN